VAKGRVILSCSLKSPLPCWEIPERPGNNRKRTQSEQAAQPGKHLCPSRYKTPLPTQTLRQPDSVDRKPLSQKALSQGNVRPEGQRGFSG